MSNATKAAGRWLRNRWIPILLGVVVGVFLGLVLCINVVLDWPWCDTLPRRYKCP